MNNQPIDTQEAANAHAQEAANALAQEIWKPDVILAGPGGSKAFLMLGCLKRLFETSETSETSETFHQENYLDQVTKWVGVSAGAAICLLLVVGYTIEEIIELCLSVSILDDVLCIKLNEIKEKMGLIRNKTVEDKLTTYVKNKFNKIPTLAELYLLTNKELTIVTYNLDKMRAEYLNKDTEPDLSCVEATMMSMAIPVLIQPRKYKGNIYIDGGIGAPYPISLHDNGQNNILGLYIAAEEDFYCSDKKPVNFIYHLIQAGMKAFRDQEIKHASKTVKHIALKTTVRDTTGLSLNSEDRENMINQGYLYAEHFLKQTEYEHINDTEEISFL